MSKVNSRNISALKELLKSKTSPDLTNALSKQEDIILDTKGTAVPHSPSKSVVDITIVIKKEAQSTFFPSPSQPPDGSE